jgi:hypothetical protein
MIILFSSISAFAQSLNLMPYARVTASGTLQKFLGLWPREMEDAGFTVRDGIDQSAWKPKYQGASILQADFAPLNPHPIAFDHLEPQWDSIPANGAILRISDYCGGTPVFEGQWNDPTTIFAFDETAVGFCLELIVNDPGYAALADLRVYSRAIDGKPKPTTLSVEPMERQELLVRYSSNVWTHHVDIHYSNQTTLDAYTLIDTVAPSGTYIIPRPIEEGMNLAIVPIAADGTRGDPLFFPAVTRTEPTLENNGVIEGFYGIWWSELERRRMILHLARLGLRIYMYAPKDEPLHREQWDVPYDEETMERFYELHALGQSLGVDVYYGIAPGKTMILDDPDDRAKVLAKLTPFADGGYRQFLIMFDDIENDIGVPVDGTLGAMHADLVNWIMDALEDYTDDSVSIWVNPLAKRYEHMTEWPGGIAYAEALGEGTDPDVVLFWGAPTDGELLDAEYFDQAINLYGRKPAFWDNDYAIDGGDGFTARIQLAPVLSRSGDLYDGIAGYVTNQMFLGSAARLPVTSFGAYMHDPTGYDPTLQAQSAADNESLSSMDRELLVYLQRTFYGNNGHCMPLVGFPYNLPMDKAIDTLKVSIDSGVEERVFNDAYSLVRVAARMATLQNDLHHSGLDTFFVDDLRYPTDRTLHEGMALLYLMRWLGTAIAGAEEPSWLEDADRYFLIALTDRYHVSFLKAELLRRYLVKRAEIPQFTFVPPVIAAPPDQPRVGQSWTFQATEADAAVYGLPGATVSGGEIRWSASHPGTYMAVITAITENGWAWRTFDILVAPAEDENGDGDNDDSGDDDNDADHDNHSADDDDDDSGCGC